MLKVRGACSEVEGLLAGDTTELFFLAFFPFTDQPLASELLSFSSTVFLGADNLL